MSKCLFLLLCLLPCQFARGEVNVAAAISLKESLTGIGAKFTNETGEKVNFTFGASGQLARQIRGGTALDLFISAANLQVDDLIRESFADASTRTVVARNQLVLVVPVGSDSILGFEDLPKASRIAMGEPKTVPAGQYAAQVLKSLKLMDRVKDKLIFGTNVRQVLDLVIRGEVDGGIVYLTDAKQAGEKVKVVAIANAESHEPIEYPAVLLTNAPHPDAAKKFLAFLKTDAAQNVFAAGGFAKP